MSMKRHDDGESFGIAAMDVLFNFAFVFVVLFGLQQVFTEVEKADKAKTDGMVAGTMCVEIQWPFEDDVDLDLWVQGPDGKIIGYSNKNGPLFSLLRDDLGSYMDEGKANLEMACTTAAREGEYTLNVHYYTDRGSGKQVPVTMTVRFPTSDGPPKRGYNVKKTMQAPGQELTFMNFVLGSDGEIRDNTINDFNEPLRSKGMSR